MATPIDIKTLQIKKDEDTIYKLSIEGLAPAATTADPYLKKSDGDSYYAPVAATTDPYLIKSTADLIYATLGHTHSVTDINGLSAGGGIDINQLASKVHTHQISDIEDFTPANYATVGHQHSFSEITNKPSGYTPSSHTHSVNDIIGVTPSDYVNITSITATISGSTTSDYIPTEAAIIKYLNS